MLLNDIDYDIYYCGGGHERPLRRRQSWPRKRSSTARTSTSAGAGPRRLIGRALIGLGQMIAPEPVVTAKPRMAGQSR